MGTDDWVQRAVTSAAMVCGLFDHNSQVEQLLAFRRAIFAWCLRQARRCAGRDAVEEALQWNQLAARVGCMDCAVLASRELEANLLAAAARLPVPDLKQPRVADRPRRWLHVFSEAGPSAGHTAMAWRWMSLDPEPNRHSLVLLSQQTPVSEQLVEMVARRGGEVVRMDPHAPILARAERLRAFAWAEADVVVLHVHPWDVNATLAFGIPSGPPVLLVNHSAHLFGVGGSVADLVINTRLSAQEDEWTIRYRGVGADRTAWLPLPMPPPTWRSRSAEMRLAARQGLGLPALAPVLLTVGDSYKYSPLPGLDFLETAVTILQARPSVHLVAAGVREDARWRQAREATGGRLRAVGRQLDLRPYHAAADVYIEGFPCGSTTALLEAGHHSLACVMAPRLSPPPFGTEGLAFDEAGVDQPGDVAEYVKRVMTFLDDPDARERCGQALVAAIEANHSGEGWRAKLERLKRSIPARHEVHPLDEPPPIPGPMVAFWAAVTARFRDDALGIVYRSAARLGLKPRLDLPIRRATRAAKGVRTLHPPLRRLITCTDYAATLVPAGRSAWLYKLYDWSATVLREDGKLTRVWRALTSALDGRHGCAQGPDA